MPATITAGPPMAADIIRTGDRFLEREVAELMTPGVTCISTDASLRDAERAMLSARVHAILVVACDTGAPLGWITSRGLLGMVGRDRSITPAYDAITEGVTTIRPSASARAALDALMRPGTTHLLVTRARDRWPVGVLSDVDLVRLAAS